MSQDLSGINKPRAANLGQAVGAPTATRAVGQGAGSAADRQFNNPHDDQNWDNFTPQHPTEATTTTIIGGDEPLVLSISALQAMLEDPSAAIDLPDNMRAKWLSRLVLLRGKGWSQVVWYAGESLPQLLVRLWADAGLADGG